MTVLAGAGWSCQWIAVNADRQDTAASASRSTDSLAISDRSVVQPFCVIQQEAAAGAVEGGGWEIWEVDHLLPSFVYRSCMGKFRGGRRQGNRGAAARQGQGRRGGRWGSRTRGCHKTKPFFFGF